MISFTFMKQLLFSAKLAAVRLRQVAEFILVRGITARDAGHIRFHQYCVSAFVTSVSFTENDSLWRWHRGGPVETHVRYLSRSNFTFPRKISTNRQE